jgi:hypothetical protein
MDDDKIIQIDAIRIERNRPRKCICEQRHFTIDTKNKQVTCECGTVYDPFDALLDIANHYERIDEAHQSLRRQRDQWYKEKPWSVLFKKLEQHYKRGEMLPNCPKCRQIFDFKDITGWSNAEFYRKWNAKRGENP